jgi:hypothetical protein
MWPMAPASRDDLIAVLQRTARENGNRPLGQRSFYVETRTSRRDLWNVGIRNYGELCELAGYPPNAFQEAIDPNYLMEALAKLASRLGRFPGSTDREMARRSDSTFPAAETYRAARRKRGPLEEQLRDWCRLRPEYAAVQSLAAGAISTSSRAAGRVNSGGKMVAGYVYLMRYGGTGRHYKIGMSDDTGRRLSQLSGMVPGNLRLLHIIETDDPAGIERYWLQRFQGKLVKGKKEIFQLDAADVAAFKSRKYQ